MNLLNYNLRYDQSINTIDKNLVFTFENKESKESKNLSFDLQDVEFLCEMQGIELSFIKELPDANTDIFDKLISVYNWSDVTN